MSVSLEAVLARAGDDVLQALLGPGPLRLLNSLSDSYLVPSALQRLVIAVHGKHGLLESGETRSKLIELLRPNEAVSLAAMLGLSTDDAYGALRAARISKGSDREANLYAYFQLPPPPIEDQEASAPVTVTDPAYGLFEHQRRALRRLDEVLARDRRVVLHMPTGSGKTRTAANLIAEHLRSTEGGVVVWLAYSEELCEQAAAEIERAWRTLGNRAVKVYRFWGSMEAPSVPLHDAVVVAGLGKSYSLATRNTHLLGQLALSVTLVIIDEAHQAVADTYALVLDALTVGEPQPALVGLTATPGRTWSDIEEDRRLADFFHRNKVLLEIEGYDNPVDYLTEAGYLARVRFSRIQVENDFRLTNAELGAIEGGLDVPRAVLDRLADDEARSLRVLHAIEELAGRHKRIIVFATTMAHSNVLATVLQARGHNAVSVTSRSSAVERARAINDFKSDTAGTRILCNFGVLTTGFDAPRTSAALIARPTKSLVLYSQMVGRAIRGPLAGGNPEAEVVTVIDDALPGFGSVAEAFINWEDVWNA